jgi:hypothetical protein
MSTFTPAVFIGIGGAGLHILLRIRRLIVENYKKLENLPSVRFLHMDTSEQMGPDAGVNIPLEVLGQSLQFKDAERCIISHKINDEIRQSLDSIKANPTVKDWFDSSLPLDNNFSQGAGGIRPYGRLAFHYAVDMFRQKVGNCLVEASNPTNAQKTAEVLDMTLGTGLDVYIVCSLMGGTGSGTFLEVCYNTRAAVKGKIKAPDLTGVFIISGADVDSRRKANCYSALMEMEYHATQALLGKTHFTARYPIPDITLIQESKPPVEICYLASHLGEGGYALGRDQMEEAIALNLFMEFGSTISEEKKIRRTDFTSIEAFHQPDEELKRSRQFLSFGITTLEFPAPRVQDMMAHELAAYAVKGWLFAEKKESPDLERDRKDIEATLDENNLVTALLTFDNKHLLHRVATKLSDQEQRIKTMIDQASIDGDLILTTAKGNIDSDIESMNFSMDAKQCGEYARQISRKSHDIQQEIARTITRKVHDLIENEFRGPQEAQAYLAAIGQLLGKLQKRFKGQYDSVQNAASRAHEAVLNSGLKKLRENLGQEKFAMHFHNRKIHSEFLLTYLNVSAKREAYRAALAMLANDRREDDGAVVSSLMSLVNGLLKEVQQYTDSLNQLSGSLVNRGEEIEKTILNTPIAEGIKLKPNELKEITKSIVPNPAYYVTSLLGYVKDSFSEKDKEGNVIKDAKIMDLINRRRDPVESGLLQRCSEICEAVKKISVAARIKDKPKLRDILSQKIRLSKPMIQASGFKGGENIRLHWLATADPLQDLDLKGVCDTIDTIYQYKGNEGRDRHLSNLADPYRIIFASEKGIFPLQRISLLQEYRTEYKMIKPKHTDIRIAYDDILPTTEEDKIKKRAAKAALLGKFFGFLNQRQDPETCYDYIFISFFDGASRTYEHRQVGDKWEEVEEALAKQQIAKQIDNQVTGTTHLEKLEDLIKEKGASPKTRMEKELLWRMLQNYLDELVEKLEGGDMNQEFQRQRDIIQEFRNSYGILPPEGQKPEPPSKSPSSPATPSPSPEAHFSSASSEQMAVYSKFRRVIEDHFQKGIREKEKLIQYGTFMLKLSKEDAAKIYDEAAGQDLNLDQLLNAYKVGFEAVVMNNEITAEERAILREKQQELALTDEQVREIEEPYTKPIYENFFKVAGIDEIIQPYERARLRELQQILNLSDAQIQQVEANYSFKEE